jgi:dienelactone hydrolase
MGEKSLSQEVQIETEGKFIKGNLNVPEEAHGLVIFAHGSGSGRFSPRNRYVAEVLNRANMATLLIDLLTEDEEKEDEITGQYRFNIDLLAGRLVSSTRFTSENQFTRNLKVGYFGASTGTAAALVAAAQLPEKIEAVVSRGGRPDLAGEDLSKVETAVLFLVGGEDYPVIDLNKKALEKLTKAKDKKLVIVPGATHLFEEEGKLEEVAGHAAAWFDRYL